ncbi:CehA/McbA family metallohydrolase [Candidatus Saccharibacteria bacterium]|nr:CehA/McbA family metallohydrolase [Candidatus Saccharibacteria bacterium]
MQDKILISRDRPKLKGGLHIHTKIDFPANDGMIPEAEVVGVYRQKGYDFLAITNHEIMYDIPQVYEDFLLIPSMEVSCNYVGDDPMKGSYTHFNIFGDKIWDNGIIYPKFEYSSVEDIQRVINLLKSRGYLVQWNHPLISRFTEEEFLSLRGYDFIEIYNHKDFLEKTGILAANYMYRSLLNHGHRILHTATDDFHGKEDPALTRAFIKSFVMVEADLDRDDIFTALGRGSFYSSTGPLIHDYRIENGVIKIETSPVANIIFLSQRNGCKNVFSVNGDQIEKAEYEISGEEDYVLTQVIDAHGNPAWTQPIFLYDV